MSEEWTSEPLRDLLVDTFAGEWGQEPTPMNCTVFRSTDIDDQGNVVGSGAPRRLTAAKLLQKQLQEGDILLEASGGSPDKPVGRSALVDERLASMAATCSNFFRVMRPNTRKVHPGFLNHKLVWRYRQPEIHFFQQQTTGIINLKFQDFLDAKLAIPSNTAHQSKIAEILDTLDAAIRGTEGVVGKLRAMKQGLLSDLLTRGIDQNGDLRPSPTEAPHLYHQTPLGLLPKGWEVVELKSACSLIKDGTHLPPKRVDEGPLLLSVRNMIDGQLVETDQDTRISHAFYMQMHRGWKVEVGDVLLAIVGATIGKSAQVGKMPPFTLQRSVAVLRGQNGRCENNFLFLYVGSTAFQNALWAQVNQTAQPGIYLDVLGRIRIVLPSEQEQREIVSRIGALEARITQEQTLLAKLRLQKAGLMEDLLTGRVSVAALVEA